MSYYEQNKESRIAYQKEYNSINREKIKVYQSKYWGQRYLRRKLSTHLIPPKSNYISFNI